MVNYLQNCSLFEKCNIHIIMFNHFTFSYASMIFTFRKVLSIFNLCFCLVFSYCICQLSIVNCCSIAVTWYVASNRHKMLILRREYLINCQVSCCSHLNSLFTPAGVITDVCCLTFLSINKHSSQFCCGVVCKRKKWDPE